MRYESPRLFSLEYAFGAPYCGNGGTASGDGCNDGSIVGTYCAAGNDKNGVCANGSGASPCAVGGSPGSSAPNCWTGTSP